MKRYGHFAILVILLGALLATGLRIAQVNQEISVVLSPSEAPGTYKLNEVPIPNEPWKVPAAREGARAYETLTIEKIGTVTLKSFSQVSSEVEIPVDYQEFDKEGTVMYAFLDITFSNSGADEISVQFQDFWLFADIVPGSYASGLIRPYNIGKTSTLGSHESETFTVVYRLLKSGFDSESWNRLDELPFSFALYAYPNKYVYDLTIGNGAN